MARTPNDPCVCSNCSQLRTKVANVRAVNDAASGVIYMLCVGFWQFLHGSGAAGGAPEGGGYAGSPPEGVVCAE